MKISTQTSSDSVSTLSKLEEIINRTNTVAFLIVHKDTLIYESYSKKYDVDSPVVCFSMTKSFFSVLFGCAIDDGLIPSIDTPVADYLPEISHGLKDTLRISHLLNMTSGLDYKEPAWSPFALHNRLYWGDNLEKKLRKLRQKVPSGQRFQYKSLDTQLLGVILKRSLKNESISEYFERKIWKPMGMEYEAVWSTDSSGKLEKVFSSLTACPIDIIKFGSLVMNKGEFNNHTIVSVEWLIANREEMEVYTEGIEYQKKWYYSVNEPEVQFASGHLGQILYIDKARQVVILRMGSERVYPTKEWLRIFAEICSDLSSMEGQSVTNQLLD
ncbi:MAG: serine hydrolase [Candidatus Cloacimonetes bacterium]|nr:serine hydrolase [Candidatus Cloacimonadota bacterium]